MFRTLLQQGENGEPDFAEFEESAAGSARKTRKRSPFFPWTPTASAVRFPMSSHKIPIRGTATFAGAMTAF